MNDKITGFIMVDLGSYPALITFNTNNIIFGEVYEINTSDLDKLDKLEGYPRFYNRKVVKTLSGKECIVYFLDNHNKNISGRGKIVPSGDWVKYLQNKLNETVKKTASEIYDEEKEKEEKKAKEEKRAKNKLLEMIHRFTRTKSNNEGE
jgi:gamma-glutamylcyclotransferase (GGCT)/AIG2-like uncharacterized protein YtfP